MRWSLGILSSRWSFALTAVLALSAAGCANDVGDDDVAGSASAQSRGWKVLNVQYRAQETGYWCGPAATRMALSARMSPPTQAVLARNLRTTRNGTDTIDQVVSGLNRYLGNVYASRILSARELTPQQTNVLWEDVVRGIDNNFPLVVNIVSRPGNRPPGYPARWVYHYVAVIGYNPQTTEVYVADSARFKGIEKYWIPLSQLASLVAPKGYAYWVQQGTRCDGGNGVVHGAIERKYVALGGCRSFLGAPVGNETRSPDKAGRFNVFQNGSIYWSEATGAFEVHGAIRDEWKEAGWEVGFLGYPTSDELATPDNVGRYNKFQKGAIYFAPKTGTHSIHGRIHEKWAALDFEKGDLGYPTTAEYDANGQRKQDFEGGSITWDPKTDTTAVSLKPEGKVDPNEEADE